MLWDLPKVTQPVKGRAHTFTPGHTTVIKFLSNKGHGPLTVYKKPGKKKFQRLMVSEAN